MAVPPPAEFWYPPAPLMCPLLIKVRDDPVGKDPEIVRAGEPVEEEPIQTPPATVTVPMTGDVPFQPAAVSWERKSALFALDEIVALTTTAAETTRPPLSDCVAVVPVTLSVAKAVRGKVPVEAVVPEITPFAVLSVKPDGSVPAAHDQVTPSMPGAVVAAKVCE